jgi:hypothetical protein
LTQKSEMLFIVHTKSYIYIFITVVFPSLQWNSGLIRKVASLDRVNLVVFFLLLSQYINISIHSDLLIILTFWSSLVNMLIWFSVSDSQNSEYFPLFLHFLAYLSINLTRYFIATSSRSWCSVFSKWICTVLQTSNSWAHSHILLNK